MALWQAISANRVSPDIIETMNYETPQPVYNGPTPNNPMPSGILFLFTIVEEKSVHL